MGIIVDYRPTKSLFSDRENHHYAEDKNITRLICDDCPAIINIVCKLLFGDKGFNEKEYNYIVTLYIIFINNRKNECDKRGIFEFISKRNNVSTRSLERYTNKLISYGILTVNNGILSFTKYYNPVNIKFPTTDFIVLEVNPKKTSNMIELMNNFELKQGDGSINIKPKKD